MSRVLESEEAPQRASSHALVEAFDGRHAELLKRTEEKRKKKKKTGSRAVGLCSRRFFWGGFWVGLVELET